MSKLWLLLRSTPGGVWLVAVCLASGAWVYHRAVSAEREADTERQLRTQAEQHAAALQRRLEDTERISTAQRKAVDEAQLTAQRDRAAADRAADAERGLRERLAAALARSDEATGAAAASPPATDAERMLADVLGRCATRVRRLAAIADERGNAGATCERAYDALSPSAETER